MKEKINGIYGLLEIAVAHQTSITLDGHEIKSLLAEREERENMAYLLSKTILDMKEDRAKNRYVWDVAPEEANRVILYYFNDKANKDQPLSYDCYTRELPKTRAREIAEELWQDINNAVWEHSLKDGAPVNIIETAILKREAELKESTNARD